MSDDDWDVDDDTDCTKQMPKISLFVVKKPKAPIKQKCTEPYLTSFECECVETGWDKVESVEIRPVDSTENTGDIKYMLRRDEATDQFRVEIVAVKQEGEVQCYWKCTKEENIFEAFFYSCERLVFGATYINPYTGNIEDGIFGPDTYGKILFGKKWKCI
jgi:hypothetical protein